MFVSQKIKELAALDRHEKRGVNNLLSFTLNIISKEKPGFSLWENPGKHPRDFFFFPEQTLRALRGEATRSPACWAPSFKGSRIHRWVRSGRRFCLLGSEKRNVSGNADRPVLTDSAVPASAAKIGLIKAPLKFTSTEFSLLTRPRWQKGLRWTSPVLDLNQQLC